MSKSAFIVGASTGIGFGLAKEFHSRGYTVYAGSRNVAKMEPLAALGIKTLPLDVTSKESIEKARDFIEKDNGGVLDVIYLNAGIAGRGTLFDASMDEVRKTFETNVFGPMMVIQAFHRILLKNESVVAFTGSMATQVQIPFQYAYNASKTAFDLLATQLALETSKLGIKVVNIRSGAVESEIWTEPYVVPENSVYNVRAPGEPLSKLTSVPSKSPTAKYCRKVVDDVERAARRQRFYTLKYRGDGTTLGWILGMLPFKSCFVPLMNSLTKTNEVYPLVKKRVQQKDC